MSDYKKRGNVLIMTSVSAERDAILKGLNEANNFDVVVCGVGIAAAATSTATVLASRNYDLVINAGICGGFKEKAPIGSIVVANEIIAADLGVETKDGFTRLDVLGFGVSQYTSNHCNVENVIKPLENAKLPMVVGTMLTVATVTGTVETERKLKSLFPNACGGAMEGFGVATAANYHHIPFLEIRTVSNLVGPRDRESWKINEALKMLTKVSSILQEVI